MDGRTLKEQLGDRFLSKVRFRSDGCWEWAGSRFVGAGYGQFVAPESCRAHRYAYIRMIGPVPRELVLDHLCRRPWCVNPQHLEPVTVRENVLRGCGLCAENARRVKCVHGHDLSGDNLLQIGRRRRCKTCNRVRALAHYHAKRARAG